MIDIELNNIDDVDAFLEHFGVKGMHWGIRNEEEKKAHREKQAQKFDAKALKYKLLLDKLNNRQSTYWNRQAIADTRKDLTERISRAEADAKAKREGKLGPTAKRRLIGAGIAGGILAAYGTYQLSQSGEVHRLALKGKALLGDKNATTWAKNDILSKPDLTPEAIKSLVVDKINPDYGKFGTKMNCRRATFAYEMRRRGNDVIATRTTNGRGQDASGLYNVINPDQKNFVNPGRGGIVTRILTEKITRNPEAPFTRHVVKNGFIGLNKTAPENIFKDLAHYPNGARGELGIKWDVGGGHSVAWEIIKGKPVIIDAQTGKMFKSLDEMRKGYNGIGISKAGYTRLDNMQLNENFLLRWLKNA